MNHQDPEAALEELIVRALDVLEDEGEAGLVALLARHPEQAEAVRAALSTLELRGLTATASDGGRASFPERLGGYELVRPLGGGGMGVVYLAHDAELGREVALKLVRPDQLHFPGARERFRREVRTIARLQHAGIVPLFGVGEDQGVPFYAMELVRGCTLAEVVRELEGRAPEELTGADLRGVLEQHADGDVESGEASTLFDGSWESVCLRIVREVAEALEYAHRRGVVHRDVKPSNVMLTLAGRVQLFDFGLSSRRGGTRITRTGSALGSLAYMAPEMLRGEAHEDDARLDVYSLGVTLFELLTLTLPFSARSEGELRKAVLDGDVVPLARKRNARASWEAETLCQVAVDPEPKHRYATAGAFAQDLTNALEGRPLLARPPGPLLRVRRWAQRHPMTAVLLLAMILGPSLLAWREVQNTRVVLAKSREITRQSEELRVTGQELAEKNRALGEALLAEEGARRRAEENFEQALAAVDRLLTRIGDEKLANVPHFEVTRRDLLTDALEFYQELLTRAEGDRGVGMETARVANRAADLSASLGRNEEALELVLQSERILRELFATVDDEGARSLLALVLRRKAALSLLVNEPGVAAAEFLDEADTLTPASDDAAGLQEKAGGLLERAKLQAHRGEAVAAIATLEESIRGYEELVARFPESLALRDDLARAFDELSTLFVDNLTALPGGPDVVLERALATSLLALELARENVEDAPNDPQVRFRLARNAQNYANLLVNHQRGQEAEVISIEAQEVLERLVADFPSVELYRRDLAFMYMNRGSNHAHLNTPGAEELLERSIVLFRELGVHESGEPRMRMALANALYNAGFTRVMADDLAEARGRFDEAERQFAVLDGFAKGSARYLDQRMRLRSGRADAYIWGGRHDEAFEAAIFCCELGRAVDHSAGAGRVAALLDDMDARLPAEEAARKAGLYAEFLILVLEDAVDAGLLTKDGLRANEDLARLWQEPALREWLAER